MARRYCVWFLVIVAKVTMGGILHVFVRNGKICHQVIPLGVAGVPVYIESKLDANGIKQMMTGRNKVTELRIYLDDRDPKLNWRLTLDWFAVFTGLDSLEVYFGGWTQSIDQGLWRRVMRILSNNSQTITSVLLFRKKLPDDFVPSLQAALSGSSPVYLSLVMPLTTKLADDLCIALLPEFSGRTRHLPTVVTVVTHGLEATRIWTIEVLLAIYATEQNKRDRQIALTMGFHPRLGAASPLLELIHDLIPEILRKL
jgi:hypothetical protein